MNRRKGIGESRSRLPAGMEKEVRGERVWSESAVPVEPLVALLALCAPLLDAVGVKRGEEG